MLTQSRKSVSSNMKVVSRAGDSASRGLTLKATESGILPGTRTSVDTPTQKVRCSGECFSIEGDIRLPSANRNLYGCAELVRANAIVTISSTHLVIGFSLRKLQQARQ